MEEQKVSLEFYNTPIREVLDEIEKQTGLSFSYSSRLLEEKQNISIYVEESSLDNALKIVFEDLRIKYGNMLLSEAFTKADKKSYQIFINCLDK